MRGGKRRNDKQSAPTGLTWRSCSEGTGDPRSPKNGHSTGNGFRLFPSSHSSPTNKEPRGGLLREDHRL